MTGQCNTYFKVSICATPESPPEKEPILKLLNWLLHHWLGRTITYQSI